MNSRQTHFFSKIKNTLHSLLELIYPSLCVSCDQKLHHRDDLFCIECASHCPITDFHEQQYNLFTTHFTTLQPLVTGTAMYMYVKGGKVQHSLELLKFRDRPDIGLRYGERYGNILKQSSLYQNIDYIIPLPLHTKRQALRGYNQSELFAKGLSDAMDVKLLNNVIQRVKQTDQQVHKNRLDRLDNMKGVFEYNSSMILNGKSVLLVDDVLTTGATLQSCAEQIIEANPSVKLYMATIAIGK